MTVHTTTQDGRALRLFVPDGPPPAAGWPLLVMLDGDWVWPVPEAPDANAAGCALLLPGFGAPPENKVRRALDFTPPAPDGRPWRDPRRPHWACGGAPAFLDALDGPMRRWAHAQAPIDAQRQALYGHSYGGLFALWTLRHRPDAFSHFVCASPSLWWQDGFVARQMAGLAAHPPARATRVTVLAGGAERWHTRPPAVRALHPEDRGQPTLPAVRALVAELTRVERLRVQLVVLPGLDHRAMLPASAQYALSWAHAPGDAEAEADTNVDVNAGGTHAR